MRAILGSSQALQRKNQDIVNTITLVKVCKLELQIMRESGWSSLHDEVSCFCEKYNIEIPNMDDIFLTRGRPRRKAHEIKNLHYYQIDLFYVIIDI